MTFTQLELAPALPLPSPETQRLRLAWHAAAVARQRQCDSPDERVAAETAYTAAHSAWHAHRRGLGAHGENVAAAWWRGTECGRVPSRCECDR